MLHIYKTQGFTHEVIREQKFKSGFIGGVASKFSDNLLDSDSLKNADAFTKATIAGIIGGIASKASGGDFIEGAMSAMVVYLWNYDFDNLLLKDKGVPMAMGGDGKGSVVENPPGKLVKTFTNIKDGLKRDIPKMWQNAHPAAKGCLVVSGAIVVAPAAIETGTAVYYYSMRNPDKIFIVLDFIEGYLPGVPPMNWAGITGFTVSYLQDSLKNE